MRCSSSSARPASGGYLVSGHRLDKTLAKTLTNCLTKYVRSSADKSITKSALNDRFIEILSRHLVEPKLQGVLLENSNFSGAVVRINAFFSSGANDFDMEYYEKLHGEYWASVGDSQRLVAENHYDRVMTIAERFMVAKLPGRLFIELEPCRFKHIKSMSGLLSEAFLLLNRGCALILLNGMYVAGKKVIYPQMESACLLLTWEQSLQDDCQDRAQLLDHNFELCWLRGEYDASETYPAFLNRFIHDVADYGSFNVKEAGMKSEEIRLFIIHDQPEYRDLAGLALQPILGAW